MPGSSLTILSGRPLAAAYVEHASIFIKDGVAVCQDEKATVSLPSLRLLLLMIGPGCSITSAAVRQLTADGATVGWTSTSMAKLQAVVYERNRRNDWIRAQAKVSSVSRQREAAARRLWKIISGKAGGGEWTVIEIRAADSQRMREAYQNSAHTHGLEWKSRVHRPASDDTVNIALNVSAATLYSVLCAGVVALGLEPALGVVHSETHMAWVFDLADIWRVSVVVEAAMSVAALPEELRPQLIRLTCLRTLELIAHEKVLDRLPGICQKVLALP